MSVDATRYLEMERAFYADLVSRSNFASEAFTRVNTAELVVGSYAQHEEFDYERWLFGGVPIDPTALALEYGCGPGRMLLRMASRFHRVDGVDISPEVLDVARRRVASLATPSRLYLNDGKELPGGLDGSYGVAFSVICLQHICVYAVRRRILEGLWRALKPGGLLTFQMGYGPGHPRMVDYFADFVEAPGTNGAADVGVLHPAEIAGDLAGLGFTAMAYALAPSGPGDTHGGWIFVRALKPATRGTAVVMPDAWRLFGFMPLVRDEGAVARARQLHQERGIMARARELELQLASANQRAQRAEEDARRGAQDAAHCVDAAQVRLRELEQQAAAAARTVEEQRAAAVKAAEDQQALAARTLAERMAEAERQASQREAVSRRAIDAIARERDRIEDALRVARTEIEVSRRQSAHAHRDIARLERRAEVDERQLRRLRVADRRRVRGLVADLVAECAAAKRPLAVFGAGEHTTWLLGETVLAGAADLSFFDSDPARAGSIVAGRTVRAASQIRECRPGAVLVSSLAFQEEMVAFLESLSIPDMRIVCCYP